MHGEAFGHDGNVQAPSSNEGPAWSDGQGQHLNKAPFQPCYHSQVICIALALHPGTLHFNLRTAFLVFCWCFPPLPRSFSSLPCCENHARKMRTFFTRRLEPKTKSSNAFKWSLRPNASETFSNKLQLNKVQSSLRQTSAKTTQVRSKAKTS